MFNPFGDFESEGYLRNARKDKDESVIKLFEHNSFRANLDDALAYLAARKTCSTRTSSKSIGFCSSITTHGLGKIE
jgi:hypothetical protein